MQIFPLPPKCTHNFGMCPTAYKSSLLDFDSFFPIIVIQRMQGYILEDVHWIQKMIDKEITPIWKLVEDGEPFHARWYMWFCFIPFGLPIACLQRLHVQFACIESMHFVTFRKKAPMFFIDSLTQMIAMPPPYKYTSIFFTLCFVGITRDNITCPFLIAMDRGILQFTNTTNYTRYDVLLMPNGLSPSISKPNLKVLGSSLKAGHKLSICCQAGVSAGILHFPSLE